jgi:class 3 adenylate cyclase
VHKGRVVKRTGDGAIAEFRSVVDAVRCAIEIQNPEHDGRAQYRLAGRAGASSSASAFIWATWSRRATAT